MPCDQAAAATARSFCKEKSLDDPDGASYRFSKGTGLGI
jgi:hypothetical protein